MTVNYETAKKSIGKAVKYWRLIEGFKQREIAEKLGVNRPYIAKLERGLVGVAIKQINAMANILGVSPYTLLRGYPPEKAIDIINDMYHDIDLSITRQEHETLWCQTINDLSKKKYHKILCVLRGGKWH